MLGFIHNSNAFSRSLGLDDRGFNRFRLSDDRNRCRRLGGSFGCLFDRRGLLNGYCVRKRAAAISAEAHSRRTYLSAFRADALLLQQLCRLAVFIKLYKARLGLFRRSAVGSDALIYRSRRLIRGLAGLKPCKSRLAEFDYVLAHRRGISVDLRLYRGSLGIGAIAVPAELPVDIFRKSIQLLLNITEK